MREKDRIVKELEKLIYPAGYDGEIGGYGEAADFILSDRKRVLDEVEKHINEIIEEAHDGVKDDYCYVYEIESLFQTITRLKG